MKWFRALVENLSGRRDRALLISEAVVAAIAVTVFLIFLFISLS